MAFYNKVSKAKYKNKKPTSASRVQAYATEALRACTIKLGYGFGNETINKSFQQNLEIFKNKKTETYRNVM